MSEPIRLDLLFTREYDTDLEGAVAAIHDCVTATDIVLSALEQETSLTEPVMGAEAAAERVRRVFETRWLAWSHMALDAAVSYTVSDLLLITYGYLCYGAHPRSWELQRPATTAEVCHLQQQLQACLMAWHHGGPDLTLEWADVLDELCTRMLATLCVGGSHFPVPHAIFLAPDAVNVTGNAQRHFADINVNDKFENRTKVVEEAELKQEEEAAATLSTAARMALEQKRIADEDMEQDVVVYARPSSVVAESTQVMKTTRLLYLLSRLSLVAGEQLTACATHVIEEEWIVCARDKTKLLVLLEQLTGYVVTHESEQRLVELFLGRHLPIGAHESALRFCLGDWDAVSLLALVQAEVGDVRFKKLQYQAHKSCARAFGFPVAEAHEWSLTKRQQHLQQQPWDKLKDTWWLVLWDRKFRTAMGESFLDLFVVCQHQVLRYRDRWCKESALLYRCEPRPPVLLEIMGQWMVSVVYAEWDTETEAFDLELRLIPCKDACVATHCWAVHMLQAPWKGLLHNKKSIVALLRELVTETEA